MATVDVPLRQREIDKEPECRRTLPVKLGDLTRRGGNSLPHRIEDRILPIAFSRRNGTNTDDQKKNKREKVISHERADRGAT